MKFFSLLILVNVILIFGIHSSPAQTYPYFYSGSEIMKECSEESIKCSIFIGALLNERYDAGIDSILNGQKNDSEACIPYHQQLGRLVNKVRNYLLAHPSLRTDPSAADVLQQAISNSFPCY